MGVLSVFLLVLFIIVSLLLIMLVLIQNEDGDSLGGVFAGGSSSAFGSRSGNVLTRATSVLGGIFLFLSLGLALLNRTPSDAGVEKAGRQNGASVESSDWWKSDASGNGSSGGAALEFNDGVATETFIPESGAGEKAAEGETSAEAGEGAGTEATE